MAIVISRTDVRAPMHNPRTARGVKPCCCNDKTDMLAWITDWNWKVTGLPVGKTSRETKLYLHNHVKIENYVYDSHGTPCKTTPTVFDDFYLLNADGESNTKETQGVAVNPVGVKCEDKCLLISSADGYADIFRLVDADVAQFDKSDKDGDGHVLLGTTNDPHKETMAPSAGSKSEGKTKTTYKYSAGVLHCGAPGLLNIDEDKPSPSEERRANEFTLPRKTQLTTPPPLLPPAEGETEEFDEAGKSGGKGKMFTFAPVSPGGRATGQYRSVPFPRLLVPRVPGGAVGAHFLRRHGKVQTEVSASWGSSGRRRFS